MTFEQGEPARVWQQLLYPPGVNWEDGKVKEALAVNKIDPAELPGKPGFGAIANQLLDEMIDAVVVAHNAEFDLRMVNQELRRIGRPAIAPRLVLCTKCLGSLLQPDSRSNKLADVAARYNVKPNGAHRAAADADVCGRILAAMFAEGQLPSDDAAMAAFAKKSEDAWRMRRR